ncbi:thiamine phosphate synthase [Nitrospirales bacterium NOB]|nr:Thiazole tautomerase [Nitrospirota bacterium]MCE7964329.1 thiamine phosphate synthase [Nitrospira sp. NTP2]MDL1888133.1 thiamine phosphate synthase [Nitrospirales bacterium NOB]MEB2337335.1 thiamine phosphate synthase [Nitrospirales bacterium]QOJ36596.1 MAG: thiamine phosphate synthase [Nitrospira sp.]
MNPRVDFRLYLVTDRHQTAGRSLLSVVAEAARSGVRAVQLRERDLPTGPLLALAEALRQAMPATQLFLNDRVDLALALGAAGVHLRESSLPTASVRRILSPQQVIGRSVHSLEGARQAEREGADFVVLGPIYETPSKRAYGEPLGLPVLEAAARRLQIPVFAIGGITAARAREVRHAGAMGVAVLSAILGAPDVEAATCELLAAVEG